MQMLTPRDLRGMLPGQCYYVPIVDETGGMLNDPVTLKLSDNRWWISIADSDLNGRNPVPPGESALSQSGSVVGEG